MSSRPPAGGRYTPRVRLLSPFQQAILDAGVPQDETGSVFMVANTRWGFVATAALDHPGACTRHDASQVFAIFLRGSTLRPSMPWFPYEVIRPDRRNGLENETGFRLAPEHFQLDEILMMRQEGRWKGRLSAADLGKLRSALEHALGRP